MRQHPTLVDFYKAIGFSAHFLVLSTLLFLWIAFVFVLPRADRSRSIHSRLLLLCSILPLVIGICGSAFQLYAALDYVAPPAWMCDPILPRPSELVLPLLVGSFLSSVFIFSGIVTVYLIHRLPTSKPPIQKHPEAH